MGVSARAWSQDPTTRMNKVRELQRKLYVCAKRSSTRRFHALYDRIYRGDVLWEAWRRVKANRGAAGVDQETIESIEEMGLEKFLEDIQTELREGRYWPLPVQRQYIPKSDGKKRPLGIPTVRDRVVQMAAKLVIEPIFEADFLECSYGFRPKRSATQALEAIRKAGNQGYDFVVDFDIRSYFDSIDQEKLMVLVKERISDRRVLKLLRKWLKAGVMEDGTVKETLAGTPQGGVASPLLANLYLHCLDRVWEHKFKRLGLLVRYADDGVVMCRTRSQAEAAHRLISQIMARLGLKLHPEKTRPALRSVLRKPWSHFMQRWPSPRAMKRVRERIHALTDSRHSGRDLRDIIKSLNPVLRGWGNYFRTGNADAKFNQVDGYVFKRLVHWLYRRGGQRRRVKPAAWPQQRFFAMGLYRLQGSVCYPVHATQ